MAWAVFLDSAASVVSADSWRAAGEEPCASARMRCFVVGGSALSRGRVQRTDGVVAVAAVAAVCSWFVVVGSGAFCSAATAGVLMSPSAARRAKKAVMKAVQRFLALKVLMAPRFRVVRFAYLSDDVDVALDFADRRRGSADLQMNTTRLVQPASTGPRGAAGGGVISGGAIPRVIAFPRAPIGSQVGHRSISAGVYSRAAEVPYVKERRGRAVKKLLLVALAAIGGLLVYRQIQADRAEQDLWTEATDSVPAGSGV